MRVNVRDRAGVENVCKPRAIGRVIYKMIECSPEIPSSLVPLL